MAEDDEVLQRLESVSHGAVVGATGLTAQKVLLFLTNFALTHSLTVGAYGVYALGKRISVVLRMFGPLGAVQSLVRFLPEYRDDPARRNRLVGLAYATAVVASLAFGAAVFVGADAIDAATLSHPALPPVIRLFAVVVPLEVFVRVVSTVFRTLGRVEAQLFLTHVALPALRLVAVVGALAAGFSAAGVVGALAVATAVAAALSLWLSLTRTDVRPRFDVRRDEASEFYNHAGPVALSRVGRLFQSRVDVLLVGFLLTAEAAGVYNLSLFLTSILAIPLFAFNQLLPPVASELYADGEVATLNDLYGSVTRLVFTATTVLAVTAFVYRTELLAVFGEQYTRGSLVLAVFVVGRVVGNGAGATGWLLLMTDHQYLRLVNSWVLGALNVGLSYYFVVEFGLVGAALGTAGSIATINLVRLGQLRYLEGLWPYDRSYLKPLAAAAGMALVMAGFRAVLSGTVLLVVGSLAGVAAFVGLLWLLGIERRDRVIAGMLLAQYRAGEVGIARTDE